MVPIEKLRTETNQLVLSLLNDFCKTKNKKYCKLYILKVMTPLIVFSSIAAPCGQRRHTTLVSV